MLLLLVPTWQSLLSAGVALQHSTLPYQLIFIIFTNAEQDRRASLNEA